MSKCPGQDTRYWTPQDIFELACPGCGQKIEFFKDDPFLNCPNCKRKVLNARLEQGCATWCEQAHECLGLERK